MTGRFRRRRAAALIVVCGIVAACTGESKPPAAEPSRSAAASPSGDPCPSGYAEPDPNRPRITLKFGLDAARRLVTGTETVVFTPDLPVRELVFRLWPNSPSTPPNTRLVVTAARSGDASRFVVENAGAAPGLPGTLLRLPLGREAPAGEAVTVTLDFTLTLGGAVFERWGSTGKTAWWGTGHPLLAWERGVGWQTAPAARVFGEYASSEAARYDVTVEAPAADTVLITGVTDAPVDAGPGRRRWHAMNLSARDVSVTVGTFQQLTGMVDGTPVTAAVSSDTNASVATVLSQTTDALRKLTGLLGPFPFARLTVVALPTFGRRGIEFPGGFWLGPELLPATTTHEAAHEWFYGLVGDDQAKAPWLDEAFATYAEAIVNARPDAYRSALAQPGRVDGGTASFANQPVDYGNIVYGKGAAALLEARRKAGGPAFDAAIRCFLNANAWRIATAADVARALKPVPDALAVLRSAGALR